MRWFAQLPLVFAFCGCGDGLRPGESAPTATIVSPAPGTTIAAGESVEFQGQSSDSDGVVVEHEWNFGDGSGAVVEDPGPYTYAVPGVYTATYRTTDDNGLMSRPDSVEIIVTGSVSNQALRFFAGTGWYNHMVRIRVDDPNTTAPGPPADIGATDFTIEFWMRAEPGANPATGGCQKWFDSNLIIDRDRFGPARDFGVGLSEGRLIWYAGSDQQAATLCGTRLVADGAWHHVAVTRAANTGEMQIFLDGRRDAITADGPTGDISYPDDATPRNFCRVDGRNNQPCVESDPFLVFGKEKHGCCNPSFTGWLDEVRLSTVVRYTADFARPTTAFAPDASTAALYHFDEGQGSVILDSSGASGGPSHGELRLGGTPEGPQRVPSTAPTGR